MTQDFTQGAALLSLQLSLVQAFPKKSLLLPKLSCNCVKKENWDLTVDVLHQSSCHGCAGVCDQMEI